MPILLLLLLFPTLVLGELNKPLQQELHMMAAQDQAARKEIGKAGWGKAPKELKEKVKKIDQANTERLKTIIKKHSWLSKELVGKEGVGAAFLIIQHSPDTAFQESMLPYIEKSFLNGDGISGQQVSLLTDRVLLINGKKQRYGTQYDVVDGAIIFKPIKDEKDVDERRAKMQMPPLDFYKKMMEEIHGIKDHPEIDLK